MRVGDRAQRARSRGVEVVADRRADVALRVDLPGRDLGRDPVAQRLGGTDRARELDAFEQRRQVLLPGEESSLDDRRVARVRRSEGALVRTRAASCGRRSCSPDNRRSGWGRSRARGGGPSCPESQDVLAAFTTACASKRPVSRAATAVRSRLASVSSQATSVPQWSSRRSPTGSDSSTGMPSSRRSSSGPMPLRSEDRRGEVGARGEDHRLRPRSAARRRTRPRSPSSRRARRGRRACRPRSSRFGRRLASSRYAKAVFQRTPSATLRGEGSDADRARRVARVGEEREPGSLGGLDERGLERRRRRSGPTRRCGESQSHARGGDAGPRTTSPRPIRRSRPGSPRAPCTRSPPTSRRGSARPAPAVLAARPPAVGRRERAWIEDLAAASGPPRAARSRARPRRGTRADPAASLSRAASTQPAVPPPTTITSARIAGGYDARCTLTSVGALDVFSAADEGLVRARVRRAHRRAGARLAGDRAWRQRPHPGTDRFREDARGLPHRHRPPERDARRRVAAALRLAAQGAELRRRAEPAEPARRPGLRALRRRAHGRHAGRRAPADAQDPARHPHHDPGVALPAADLAGARDAARDRGGHPRRGPRRRGDASAEPIWRSPWSAWRGCWTGRCSESACRRPSGRSRRSAASSPGRAGRSSSSTRGGARSSTSRSSFPSRTCASSTRRSRRASRPWSTAATSRRGRADVAVDLAVDLPGDPRARPRAPLDDRLRQQPAPGRAARARGSTSSPARSSPVRTTARSRASSASRSRSS